MKTWTSSFRNAQSRVLTLCIEPWGERHDLQSGEKLRVVLNGPDAGEPEIVMDGSGVSVYGWEGSQRFVLQDNVCISQPTLLDLIRRLMESNRVDASKAELEVDVVEFAQRQLDAAPSWDKSGEEAAEWAIIKLIPYFTVFHDNSLIWTLCQQILNSRGVFLTPNEERLNFFIEAVSTESSEPFGILSNWSKQLVTFNDYFELKQ